MVISGSSGKGDAHFIIKKYHTNTEKENSGH